MAKWVIDSDHTVAAFAVSHFMVADVHGQFNKITGFILFDPPDMTHLSMEVTLEVAGIYTGIKKRDDHLRSADFFDEEKCPNITFKSAAVKKTGFNSFKVTGDLTIHGITKPVTFDVEYSGPVKSPYGETSIGFTATTEIDREDFGMTWNVPMGNEGFIVGKEVRLTLDMEADLAAE